MRRPLDRWLWLVVAAFVVRAALAAVLALTQLVPHNGWYWANNDQVEYYGTAHALIHGDIAAAYTFMGYGVLLAPFAIGPSSSCRRYRPPRSSSSCSPSPPRSSSTAPACGSPTAALQRSAPRSG